jgi:hypothetical protein
MVNPVLSRPSEVWMPSHRSRPIGYADISGHRILASRSTIRQADSRDRPELRTGGMESVPSISDPGRSRNVRTQFTPDDARRFDDRFGSRQDTHGFYENPALDDLVKYADFEHARSCWSSAAARAPSPADSWRRTFRQWPIILVWTSHLPRIAKSAEQVTKPSGTLPVDHRNNPG